VSGSPPSLLRPLRRVAAILVLAAAPARAASLTGTVVERGTRAPLLGVEVVLRAAADSAVVAHTSTGADGRFLLEGVPAGRYLFRASLLGHVPLVRSDLELADAQTRVDLGAVELVVSPIALPGVEKKEARSTAIVQSDRNVYLSRDLPAATAGTATDLLRAVPELDVDINDNVSLRGSSSVTIQINGRASPLRGESLAAFLRQFPAQRIERVEVIANPSAKFDPEGVAGIVNIVTKDPVDLGFSGSVFLNLGDRMQGGGPRMAWQQGKLTLSGGFSTHWGRNEFRIEDRRTNLLATPPTDYLATSRFQNRNGFGNLDGSVEFAFDKRSTLYANGMGWMNDSRSTNSNRSTITDGDGGLATDYSRVTEGRYRYGQGNGTLGFMHVIEKSRNEWTVEVRTNQSGNDNHSDFSQRFTVPADSLAIASAQDASERTREWSGQADATRPLGKFGKVEFGYRGLVRRVHGRNHLEILAGAGSAGISTYVHREDFQTGYVTLGSTFGRLSLQLGARGEIANTSFESVGRDATYENDYKSLFPSANAAWDFGKGRTVRATYSKRIERPAVWYLNPDVPASDPLNRWVGNPYLSPKYTHSYAVEASWSGSRGLLRLSPFLRETFRNWDQFKSVDAGGAQVTTWLNAAAVRSWGASLMGSLRQTGRVGGTFNLSVYRERHDASNLTQREQQDVTLWSLSGNGTLKLTPGIDLQGWLRYNPAQTLAQGRMSPNLFMNLGVRQKLGEKAWLSVTMNDPFRLWKYEFVTRDASYLQSTTQRGTMRRTALTFGWNWGKPPETRARRPSSEEAPSTEPPQPMR
jgi:outer membrane receptor protein involved in Fe transport